MGEYFSNSYCECGRKLEFTGGEYYTYMRYDKKGQMVFAICNHGVIVLDEKGVTRGSLDLWLEQFN